MKPIIHQLLFVHHQSLNLTLSASLLFSNLILWVILDFQDFIDLYLYQKKSKSNLQGYC